MDTQRRRSYPAFRRDERVAKRMDFLFDVCRISNRAADLLTQNRRVLLTESMNQSLSCADTDTERISYFLIRRRVLGFSPNAHEELKHIEPGNLVARGVLQAQTLYRVVKQSNCPACIVNLLRRQDISRLMLVAALGILGIQENKFTIAAPFETACPTRLVQNEILE